MLQSRANTQKLLHDIKNNGMPKIALKVKAGARQNSINGIIEIDNKPYLKLSIKSSPEKGKANKMIIDFLAKEWGMRKSDLTIISGKTSQYKILHIKEP